MLSYLGFQLLQGLIRLLPMSVIHLLSNFLSWMLGTVFQYRKKTITENLQQAFPNKSSKEISTIRKRTYRNLSDTSLESLKGPFLKPNDLKRRMHFINPEIIPSGSHALLVGGHQGNWEWGGLAVSLWFEQKIAGVYKPIKNKRIDNHFREKRKSWGLELLSMRATFRFLAKKIEPTILVLIADQSPGNAKTSYWTNFFNQKAAFNVGPEKIAMQKKWPVYFYKVKRVKRGFYEVKFELLTKHPDQVATGAITTAYRNALEKSIAEQPEDWLWSHRRWKKQMPEDVQYFP